MHGYNDGPEQPSVLDFAFLKDRYDYELQRKEQLTAGLTLPVGVLGALGGLIAAMAQAFNYDQSWLTKIFRGCLVADVLAFFVCLVLLGAAYHRQSYQYLPLLHALDAAKTEFDEYNEWIVANGGEIEGDFDSYLRQRIIEAADGNTEESERRHRYLFRARLALFAVLVLTALAGIPYVIDQIQR